MRRYGALAWTTAVVALGGAIAVVALPAPWSWLALLGAVGAIALLMERMMSRFERMTRVMRRRRK